MYYAQLDKNRKVVAISQLSGVVINERLIRVPSLDESLLGAFMQVDGKFVHVAATLDKTVIRADGQDTAILQIATPDFFTQVTVYNDSDEPIAVLEVTDGLATLEISSTAVGTIRLFVGDARAEVIVIAE